MLLETGEGQTPLLPIPPLSGRCHHKRCSRTQLCPCSEGSHHPNPAWTLPTSPFPSLNFSWTPNRGGFAPVQGDAVGAQPGSAELCSSRVLPQRWHRPSRRLRGAAKPQKCAFNKPTPLNEDSSCPVKSEASPSSWEHGMDVPSWVKVLWFTPEVWAGFGVPLCCTRTQLWEGSREGKTQGKTKKPLQHLAGSIPCLCLPAQLGEHNHWDGPCKDLGFWFADPCSAPGQQDWGFYPVSLCHQPPDATSKSHSPGGSDNSSNKYTPGSQAAPSAKINIIKGKKAPTSHGAWSVLHRCHRQQDPDTAAMEQSRFSHWEGPGLGLQPPLKQAGFN